jgi:anti-sigma factor (TIGR02949 family)
MSCAEMKVMLDGFLDRELGLADSVRVETHMQVCPDCTAEYGRKQALKVAICRADPRYRSPRDLRARIITAIRVPSDVSTRPRRRFRSRPR